MLDGEALGWDVGGDGDTLGLVVGAALGLVVGITLGRSVGIDGDVVGYALGVVVGVAVSDSRRRVVPASTGSHATSVVVVHAELSRSSVPHVEHVLHFARPGSS